MPKLVVRMFAALAAVFAGCCAARAESTSP
jgi:hypothetical protein